MVIELAAHTDSRGEADYNLDLSQKRANSVRNWLGREGVDKKRIKAIGYGETQIRNHCVDGVECKDEEHRENRRTEFKIISGPSSIQVEKIRLKGKG